MARSATVANDLMVREDEVNKLHLVSVVPLGIKNTQKTQERRRRDHERLYREKRRDLVDKLIAAGKDTASIIAAAQVEYPMMDKITRQFVYARRKKLEAEAPLEFFGGVE